MVRLFFLLVFLVFAMSGTDAQVRTYMSFDYGMQFPFGDLDARFGANNGLGTSFEIMEVKNHFFAGVRGSFLFGRTVNDDPLSILRTDQGDIIGNDRALADVGYRQRGYFVGAYAGKVFPLGTKNPDSGIKLAVGGGLLQHKIRLQDESGSITQITEEYAKGYDRMTNGPAIYSFLGYQYLAKNRMLNFLVGMDYHVGFTENKRAYNFDEKRRDDTKRVDQLIGFRIGLILPITHATAASSIFY